MAEQFPGYDYPGYTNGEAPPAKRGAFQSPPAPASRKEDDVFAEEEGRAAAARPPPPAAPPAKKAKKTKPDRGLFPVAAGAEGAQEGGQDAARRVPEDDAAVVAQGRSLAKRRRKSGEVRASEDLE